MDLLERMILGLEKIQEMILSYSQLPTRSKKTLSPEMKEELSTLPEETKTLYRDRILTFLERQVQVSRRMLEILECLSPTPESPTRVE